jgi:hypothetical protein
MAIDSVSDGSYQLDFVTTLLLPDEKIIYIATVGAGIYWKGIAAIIAAVVALFYGIWLAVYCLLIAGVLLYLAYSVRKYLVLAATDRRVIISRGILNPEVLQLRHHQIESIDILNTLSGNIFGFSTIILTGTGRVRWVVPYIEDAAAFQSTLMQGMMEREEHLEPKAA